MNKQIILRIKRQIENECQANRRLAGWFYSDHLLAVEKFSQELLRELPQADKETVLLGVWLHDLHRIRDLKGEHQTAGAREAGKVMAGYGYDRATIGKVKAIILTHSCDKRKPTSLEGRILATADAMSHYFNDFYLRIAVTGQRDLPEYKKWALEKLDRDYKHKLFFASAKKRVRARHDLFMKLLTLK